MSTARKPYPSDVSDAEWEFLLPYLTLMNADAPQREYDLREAFNAVRYVVKTSCQWRFLPHDFPPWTAVYQQARRWVAAGVFETITHDLRAVVRLVQEKEASPSAAILDGRTLQSTPESGGRAGYDGHKKKHGSKVHVAVDTLGNLLAVKVTAANEQERAQVADLAKQVQAVTGRTVEVAFVDQGYTGTTTASGLIVGVDVINAGTDHGQLGPMVDQIEKRFGARPRAGAGRRRVHATGRHRRSCTEVGSRCTRRSRSRRRRIGIPTCPSGATNRAWRRGGCGWARRRPSRFTGSGDRRRSG